MSSHRVVIQERVSDIHTQIFPAIHLDPTKDYEIGLTQFSVFNVTFNITNSNNKLYFYYDQGPYSLICVLIPLGLYTLNSLIKCINDIVPDSELHFELDSSQKCTIYATGKHLVFTRTDSVLSAFGFPISDIGKIKNSDKVFQEINSRESSDILIHRSDILIPHRSRRSFPESVDHINAYNANKEATLAKVLETEKGEYPSYKSETEMQYVVQQGNVEITHVPNQSLIFLQKSAESTVTNTNSSSILANTSSKSLSDYTVYYEAPFYPSLTRSKNVFITCPLITNSYKNSAHTRILHSFQIPPASIPHTTFVEVPRSVVYLPLSRRAHSLGEVVLRIEDETSNLIDFGGEYITLVLHIREVKDGSSC